MIHEACQRALKSLGADQDDITTLDRTHLGELSERELVESIAQACNVRVRQVKIPTEACTIENGALLAFDSTSGDRSPIAIPPGQRVNRELLARLEPDAYFLVRPLPLDTIRFIGLLRHIAKNTVREWLMIVLLGLAVSAFSLAMPVLTEAIFENVVPSRERTGLFVAIAGMLVVVTSLQILELFSAFFRIRLQTKLSHASKASIMDRVLSLPTSFFRSYPVGGLLTRSGIADSEQERRLISVFTAVFAGLFSVSNLVVLMYYDWRIGLISITAGAVLLARGIWLGWTKLRIERAIIESTVRVRSLLFQIFSAISKVRTAGAESKIFSRWSELFTERLNLNLASSRLSNSSAVIQSIVPLACIAAFFWVLGTDVGNDEGISPGRYLALTSSFGLFIGGVMRLANAVIEVAVAIPRMERARPILSAPLEKTRRGVRPGRLNGQIELRNVSYRYSEETPFILSEVSMRIEPGQFVAIVGPSGSGKSTLVRLLLGFESPVQGEVRYDGLPLAVLDVFEVRRQIGSVLQHDHLMAGNIYENIAAVRAISLDGAWEAARVAGLDRDLARMPMGMHSFVTPGARTFSGGERQRIMLARAVAGQPRILLLDEATSALDNQVQAEVISNLEKLSITRVVIAHRLSTIRHADLIFVLERGRVVESGDFASLIARNGLFARLARRQSL